MGGTPTRALVVPLALSPDQHAMYSRLADLYNRVWGSAVSWYDANHTVNAVGGAQGALRGPEGQIPTTARAVRVQRPARRRRGGALVELEPSEAQVVAQGVQEEADHRI